MEAEEHGGANGDLISSVADLSPYGRNLTASSSKPTVKTGAINSKRSFLWDGTKNPLVYTGNFTIRCGWMVVKQDGNFAGSYAGILSSPTVYGILTGIGGSSLFYDFQYDYYEYRLNDRIYSASVDKFGNKTLTAPAPVSSFGIIYFKFWQNLEVEGIQLGQDRNFTDRKFDGEAALLALYNRDFCEEDVRKNTFSISNSYQIAIYESFPYQGSKVDARSADKRIISDGQDEPVTRVKRGLRTSFDIAAESRDEIERHAARAFFDEYKPAKRFFFRDYENIPPIDTIVRIPENSAFEWNGAGVFKNSYRFRVTESNNLPDTFIPSPQSLPDESEDITAPSVPGTPTLTVISDTQINGSFTGSTDNIAVTHYRLRRATNSGFTTGVVDTDLGTSTTFNATGLTAGTTYYFKVLAEDAAGNQSAYSSASNATTTATDTEAPSVPDGLTLGVVSSSVINLVWDPSTDNIAVTAYEVRRALDSGFTSPVDTNVGNVLTYDATGLSPSTAYYFKVRARDAAGNWSAYSSVEHATTDAAVAFSPADLTSKLLWNKTDALSLSNNDPVASWADSFGVSSATAQSSSSLKPLYKTGIFKGATLPAVRFDNTDDRMLTAITLNAAPYSIFLVYSWNGGSGNHRMLAGEDATTHNWLVGKYDGEHKFYDGGFHSSGASAVSGTPVIISIINNGTTTSFYIDGTLVSSAATGSTNPGNLGYGVGVFSEPPDSDLAENVVYSDAKGTSDRQKMEGYLAHKWFGSGGSNPLPSDHPYKSTAP